MKQLNRWVYAIVGVIVLLFAGLVYAWSVLSTPIAAEFTSWTKAQLSMTFTIVMILFCIGSLLCGLLSGKLSAKMSVRIGAVLFLLGFFLASRTQSVAMLYIGFLDACDKYDNAYFERQNLVLIVLQEGSGSIRHEITDVRRHRIENGALDGDGHRVFPAGALRPAENTEQEGYTLVRGRV